MDGIPRPDAIIDRKRALTVAILAGGESRRLGQDKTRVIFSGKPLAARVAGRFLDIAQEVIIITSEPGKILFPGFTTYQDLIPGKGALGGLYTALHEAGRPFVAVLACDMPYASPSLVCTEMDVLARTGKDVAVPTGPSGLEPLHAVYRRKTCLHAVEGALERGERRIVSFFPGLSVYVMDQAETALHDPGNRAFVNINTPADLRQAEALEAVEEG